MVLGCLCVDFWLWSFASERELDMKQIFRLIVCVALFAGLPAFADFQKGLKAFRNDDYATALREFRPLAEQGDVKAQSFLGIMYSLGWGVPQDYMRAHMWYNLSASNGDQDSAEGRDDLAEKMTPEQIIEAQKLARECLAKNYKGC